MDKKVEKTVQKTVEYGYLEHKISEKVDSNFQERQPTKPVNKFSKFIFEIKLRLLLFDTF